MAEIHNILQRYDNGELTHDDFAEEVKFYAEEEGAWDLLDAHEELEHAHAKYFKSNGRILCDDAEQEFTDAVREYCNSIPSDSE